MVGKKSGIAKEVLKFFKRQHMKIKISKFTIESYDRVLDLWKQCEGVGLSDADSRQNIAGFLDRNPGMSLIAESDATLSGVILAGHDGRRGYLHHLAVSPGYRRQGIGRLLVNSCLEKLKDEGILKCHIMLFNNNLEGLKFWKSIGWTHRDDIGIVSRIII
jgi:ribosomal protein S18 acetylase RimI-like enzyme